MYILRVCVVGGGGGRMIYIYMWFGGGVFVRIL